MDEELSLFLEDATEQLQIMESALLDAKDGTDDVEKIGEIFRAMHTIKGTAGMFEFDSIVSFTHISENLLDDIRAGKINLDSNLASLFMQVKDTTENMVECSVNGINFSESLIETISELKDKLIIFVEDPNIVENNQTDIQSEKEDEEDDVWHISLRFDENFFTTGMDVISIFRFFNKLGEILLNIPVMSKIPNLENIDCLTTYIGFEIDFQSTCTKEEIEEIFEFVEDDVILSIFKHSDKKSLIELINTKEDDLQELLIENGTYSREDFEEEIQQVIDEPIIEEKTSDNEKENKVQDNPINETPTIKKEQTTSDTKKSSSLRVDSAKVDLLINKMGEMVMQNAKLAQFAEENNNDDLEEVSSGITVLLEEVREAVMNIRMVQVKDSFVKFKRIVNDTAKKLGKNIDFIIEGGETELDKSVVEKLSDPLVHMLRNSIDHGIEMPEIREAKNKNKKGTVYLRAYPDSGSIIIEIEDDGAGIDKEIVLQKAIDNGIVSQNANLSDKEIYKLIFEAGLSTASEVSDISGRGVGMDVVRRNIEALRGIIDIDSTINKGSKITIRLPLTLAIIDGFLVQAGHTKYIIPLDLISECIELKQDYNTIVKGSSTINIRGDILPLLDIIEFFDEEKIEGIRKNIVVVRYGNYKVGLLIDELYGEQQTVIKPLGDIFENVPGVSGGSILGTGEVALIFDISRLLEYKIKQGV